MNFPLEIASPALANFFGKKEQPYNCLVAGPVGKGLLAKPVVRNRVEIYGPLFQKSSYGNHSPGSDHCELILKPHFLGKIHQTYSNFSLWFPAAIGALY